MSIIRLLPLWLLLLLAACRTLAVSPDEFERINRNYNQMVRWQEFDAAMAGFVARELRPAFAQKVAAASAVKIVDYRVIGIECQPERGEAEVKVELDYYALPSSKLKTVLDVQKWVYVDNGGESGWRLKTLLPDFR